MIPDDGLSKLFFLTQLLTKPFIPLTFSSFVGSRIENEVLDLINAGTYDYVVLDGLHLGAPIFRNLGKIKNQKPKLSIARIILKSISGRNLTLRKKSSA